MKKKKKETGKNGSKLRTRKLALRREGSRIIRKAREEGETG